MQFLVVNWDGTDAGAPARRLAVREAHREGARERAESGMLICGGALLDDGGEMIGSACVVEHGASLGREPVAEGRHIGRRHALVRWRPERGVTAHARLSGRRTSLVTRRAGTA